MSATSSRNPPHKLAGAAEAARPVRRPWLWLAVVLAVGWSAALLLMDVETANPAVVSRDQLLESEIVVVARRLRPGSERVRVERVLYGNIDVGKELRVLNVEGLAADEGLYVFPLTPLRGDYVVTTLEGQRAPPLVYRVSPDTIESVKSILRDRL
jgi:hypothetical protein